LSSYEEYRKLQRKLEQYVDAVAVLGKINLEHPELRGCIASIAMYVLAEMEAIEKKLGETL